jgi:DNA-binding transcriptional ArsR family regulator
VAADRQAMADDLFDMLRDAQIEMSAGVRTLMNDFITQRVTMSRAQDEALAANGAERRGLVAEMIADIQALLQNIAVDNDATAAELRAALSSDYQARSAATQALLKNIAADQAVTAAELRAILSSDHQARSAATAGFMADANADRRSMAEALAKRLDAFKGMLEAQVSSSLNGFTAERADLHRSLVEMAQVWREFAAALHGNTVAAQPEPATPAPPAAKPSAEDVADRLLAYLAQHAEGVKLVELEPEFGLSRPQLGKHLRALVDSGKVVKDPETLVYKLA